MNLLALPVVIPLLAAAACLVGWKSRSFQRAIVVVSGVLHLASCAAIFVKASGGDILVLEVGSWRAPFGVVFVADLFGSIMVLVTGVIGLSVIVYSLSSIDRLRERFGYYPLLLVLIGGVSGAFLTGDLFNLYVWFEVMLMSSFVLMGLGSGREQVEASMKYVALNLIASTIFLAAAGLLYGVAGTLNMADLSQRFSGGGRSPLITSISMLFLAAFGIKAAVFPLFFWLPASYHAPPVAVSALLSGLLTKVGVYALIRTFTLVFPVPDGTTQRLLLIIAGSTMIIGVLGAIAQKELRRILSFHIISQIGYMIVGLGILTPAALAGSIFYIVHHILVKSNLFLIAGAVRFVSGTEELKNLGGLYRKAPLLALLFAIPAFSLAGVPPLSGFFSKLLVARSGIDAGRWTVVSVVLGCGILTLFSMTKIWSEVFWKDAPVDRALPAVPKGMLAPIVALAGTTVLIGLAGGPLFDLATVAGSQLLDRSAYVGAVLGGRHEGA